MAKQDVGLILRAHDRRACDLAACVRVGPRDARLVVLTGAATGADGSVEGRVVDFSDGGLGLHCRVYFPVGCELAVTLVAGADRTEIRGVVRRAVMVGRGPEYYLGLAFSDRDPRTSAALRHLAGPASDPHASAEVERA